MSERKMKIFIVEDSAAFLETIKDLLEDKGFEVSTDTQGADIAAKVQKARPDLVMLDVNLPAGDGFQICKELKSHPETYGVPVIMMTGDETIDIDKGFSFGADDCLYKPFDLDDGVRSITKLITRQRRVMVVDDDRKICDMLTLLLTGQKYKVNVSYDGQNVVEAVRKMKPDLVFLDITLPLPPDGTELCRLIKAAPEIRGIPVIMLTGNDDVESVDKCFAAGADDYIFKPFKVPELLEKVKKYLS